MMMKAFDLLLCLHRQTEQPLSSVAKPNLHWSSRGHAVLVRPVQLSSEMWMHQVQISMYNIYELQSILSNNN